MGFVGASLVVATHVEIASSHTGGAGRAPSFCLSSRRATARIHPDGRVKFRSGPMFSKSRSSALPGRGRSPGRSLFALASREINVRPDEVCRGPPPFSMDCCGETTAREDEVVQPATPLLPNRADPQANIAEDLTWL